MRSTNKLFLLTLFLFSLNAHSFEIGSFRLDAHASAGHNSAQGTYGALGADFYTFVYENLAVGVGAYYAAGEHPSRDREIGVGPFVSYAYPIVDFLVASAREDVLYVDSRQPTIEGNYPYTYGYKSNYGVASVTSFALHLFLTKNFGVGVGYRFAAALNNSDLQKGRSGVFFGLAFAI